MVTPAKNVSAFDANMAADAGYEIIIPHVNVSLSDIPDLVQDAIFSRPPNSAALTGLFIGGYDVNLAADMLDTAGKSMVKPFELSLFADPNGAYTTSAALIAVIRKCLLENHRTPLQGTRIKILGGGPVGLCAGILAAQSDAKVELVRLTENANRDAVDQFTSRYTVRLPSVSAPGKAQRSDAIRDAEVIICTAKAGIEVLDRSMLEQADQLLVAADVNAVPPSGIEGVGVMDNGTTVEMPWGGFSAIGALGIGSVKYKVQHHLLKRMLESQTALRFDFLDAYDEAVKHVK